MAKKDKDAPAEDVKKKKKKKKKDGTKDSSKKGSGKKDKKKSQDAAPTAVVYAEPQAPAAEPAREAAAASPAEPAPTVAPAHAEAAPRVESPVPAPHPAAAVQPEPGLFAAAQSVHAAPAATQPQFVVTPAPKRKGRGGLIALILAELVALVAGLVVLALILFDVNVPWPWVAKTEIALEAAAVVGTAPFSATNYGPELDTSISLPAMEALPDSGTSLSALVLHGSNPDLYMRSVEGVENFCNRDGIADFFAGDPAAAAAFVAAFAGEASAPAFEASTIAESIRELGRAQLVSDTLVVQHGYVDGGAVPLPAVLQKGTWVLLDDHGVPRVKCNGANPLTVAEAAAGTTVFTGSAWADFDPSRIVSIQPTPEVLRFFIVHSPDGSVGPVYMAGFTPVAPATPECLPNNGGEGVASLTVTNDRADAVFLYFVNNGDGCEPVESKVLLPGERWSFPDSDGWTPYPNQRYLATDGDGNVLDTYLAEPGATEWVIK